MEHPYEVMFSFRESLDEPWKFGTTNITTDKPIDALDKEQVQEVSRSIGLANNYVQVAINTTIPPMENLEAAVSKKTNAFGQVISEGDVEKADLQQALCSLDEVDEDLFFPEFDDAPEVVEAKVAEAKDICSVCPVRMKCLQSALDRNEDYGVWGGRDEVDLRRARFVDVSGKPVKDRASIICPNCKDESHKNLYVIENFGNKTDVGCHSCGLMWTAKKNLDSQAPNWGS